MFLALWEYEVKPGCEERFEKVYGPEGDWVQLFRRDSLYLKTRLVRDGFLRGAYLTMDFWESREAYERFMAGHEAEYKAIDAMGGDLTVKERKLGCFASIAE